MADWRERLVIEHADLASKLAKLDALVFATPDNRVLADAFKGLHPDDRKLLLEQHQHMTGYLQVLTKRLKRIGFEAVV